MKWTVLIAWTREVLGVSAYSLYKIFHFLGFEMDRLSICIDKRTWLIYSMYTYILLTFFPRNLLFQFLLLTQNFFLIKKRGRRSKVGAWFKSTSKKWHMVVGLCLVSGQSVGLIQIILPPMSWIHSLLNHNSVASRREISSDSEKNA